MTQNISFEMLVTHVCDAYIHEDDYDAFEICITGWEVKPLWNYNKYNYIVERFTV